MSTIENYSKIPKNVSTNDDLDFAYLRKIGVEYIEAMGGGLWSDLNDHDPGVTMLEMLAYAITDLGARMQLPIQTLIASKDDLELRNQFYRAEEILPTCPVTPLDYRKLFIDLEGVRNCWILPYEDAIVNVNCTDSLLNYEPFLIDATEQTDYSLQGLNCLLVDYETDAIISEVNEAILKTYHANRNLCEDLVEIKPICEKPVSVCASLDIERSADQNWIHAQIIDTIQQYFATQIRRYSLKDMIDKGYRMDEIFEGPLLENGFIDSNELKEAGIRTEVRLSDIINLIMSIEGVIAITNISITGCGDSEQSNEWLICIPNNCKPVLAPTPDMGEPIGECGLASVFNYKKDVLPVLYNKDLVKSLLDQIQQDREDLNALALLDQFPQIPFGDVLEVGETTTIMNDFPETYGIGLYGLAASATTTRKAQAKQLKGYLLFFDQILSTYFAHLGSIKDLFAMNAGNAPSYFTQAIKDVRGIEELVEDYEFNDDALLSEVLIADLDDKPGRRNEILDHLLARFAEQFSEYAFILQELYGSSAELELIESKEQFLAEYIPLSRRRGKGYNYTGDVWDTTNVSGLQHRVARLTGIEDYSRRDLIDISAGIGFNNPDYFWVINDDLINGTVFDPNALPAPTGDPNVLLLTSTETAFTSLCDAYKNRKTAVQLLLETTETIVNTKFTEGVADGSVVGTLLLNESGGNWTFTIIDPSIDPGIQYAISDVFTSTADLQTAILNHINSLSADSAIDSIDPKPEESMFLIEHILLRPDDTLGVNSDNFLPICVDDCDDTCMIDPYSFRVSIVLPGTSDRFGNADFRNFMDLLIRQETPSHVLPRICWIDPCQLNEFQSKYRAFVQAKKDGVMTQEILQDFIEIFSSLRNVYPGGRLFDCTSDDITGKIVLGRSNL